MRAGRLVVLIVVTMYQTVMQVRVYELTALIGVKVQNPPAVNTTRRKESKRSRARVELSPALESCKCGLEEAALTKSLEAQLAFLMRMPWWLSRAMYLGQIFKSAGEGAIANAGRAPRYGRRLQRSDPSREPMRRRDCEQIFYVVDFESSSSYGDVPMSLTQVIETGVADAQKALAALETQKQQVVAALQSHVTAHQKAAAQHNAEVAAAQQIIEQAYPSATPKAAQAAAFVLTSKSTWVAGVVGFLGRNWRYVALGLIIVSVVVACHTGLVKVP